MRYRSLILLALTALLFACNKHKNDYLTHSERVQPINTAGLSVQQGRSYYPVPNLSSKKSTVATKPSIVPPGSNLGRFGKQAQYHRQRVAKTKKPSLGRLQTQQNGALSLMMPVKSQLAWQKVGRALRKTPYQLLDQDRGMSSYYILDSESTGNRITKKTPIYRVRLVTSGKNTTVFLLDRKNKAVPVDTAKRVLTALQQQLV